MGLFIAPGVQCAKQSCPDGQYDNNGMCQDCPAGTTSDSNSGQCIWTVWDNDDCLHCDIYEHKKTVYEKSLFFSKNDIVTLKKMSASEAQQLSIHPIELTMLGETHKVTGVQNDGVNIEHYKVSPQIIEPKHVPVIKTSYCTLNKWGHQIVIENNTVKRKPINECERGTHSCHLKFERCVDTESGYTCVCAPGLERRGEICEKVLFDATTCERCPAGTEFTCTTSEKRLKSHTYTNCCRECSAGKYSDDSTGCKTCPVGQAAVDKESPCQNCAAGKYNDQNDATSWGCKTCPVGKKSKDGANSCDECEVGKFTSESGAESCIQCEAGTYQDNRGMTICYGCPSGWTTAGIEIRSRCIQSDTGK